eukprot:CAMPEP_0115342540 /NCGR_PEP_ID=MMETSP0270-20121206/92263_1 /TAXON_ID=71861 /ORGANISM="Scrippsiella trochoidea, Strain CCMP3099" /LENGTH=102 /DNA_ID=CAMNT_0002764125 /DNA_START=375 /DNA_END=680 /DNA_ORIENTATION=-
MPLMGVRRCSHVRRREHDVRAAPDVLLEERSGQVAAAARCILAACSLETSLHTNFPRMPLPSPQPLANISVDQGLPARCRARVQDLVALLSLEGQCHDGSGT